MSLFNNFGFKPLNQEENISLQPDVNQNQLNISPNTSKQDFGFKPSTGDELKKLEELQNENLDPEIERHISRLTSRGLEQAVGAPGNIRDFAYAVKDYVKQGKDDLSKKFGMKVPEEPESFKRFEEAIPVAKTVSNLLGYLPTSSQLKEKSYDLGGGYTKPKDESERIGDEVFESLVASALPGQGKRNIYRNIAAPIAGVLGKEAVKYIGGGEKAQSATQLGLNVAIPLMGGNAPKMSKDLWKDVQTNVPAVFIPTNNLLRDAQRLKNNISKGLGSASEKEALRTLDTFINKLQRGNISAEELVKSNISLNEIVGDPKLYGRGVHFFEDIRKMIKDGMADVGKQAPEWYKKWQNANEIYGAIANSNYIANTVRKSLEKSHLTSEGARALFGAATHAGLKTASAVPPLYLVYKGTQVLNRMADSPQLMKYYTNVLTSSLRGNLAATSENLEKLDKALLEEEKRGKTKPPFKNPSQKKSPSSQK